MSNPGQDKSSITDSSPELPSFTPKFRRSFDKCDPEMREMFLNLVNRFIMPPIKCYTSNKPDYRMSTKTIFCCIALQHEGLRIHLKVNNQNLFSDQLNLEECNDASKPGKNPYITFRVTSNELIDEASRLIAEASKLNIDILQSRGARLEK